MNWFHVVERLEQQPNWLVIVSAVAFSGLVGSRFHWLFNVTAHAGPGKAQAEHLCLVKSGARDLLGEKPDTLAAAGEEEIRRYVPQARQAKVIRQRVVWETKATVSLQPGTAALRLKTATPVPNLALAGDWIDTGLPATIESAVRSGMSAAKNVLACLRSPSP